MAENMRDAVIVGGGAAGLRAALTLARACRAITVVDAAEPATRRPWHVVGTSVVGIAAGRTSVPGVWAAGNVVDPAMQVSQAAADGAAVAMTINTELVFADADQAVGSARAGVA